MAGICEYLGKPYTLLSEDNLYITTLYTWTESGRKYILPSGILDRKRMKINMNMLLRSKSNYILANHIDDIVTLFNKHQYKSDPCTCMFLEGETEMGRTGFIDERIPCGKYEDIFSPYIKVDDRNTHMEIIGTFLEIADEMICIEYESNKYISFFWYGLSETLFDYYAKKHRISLGKGTPISMVDGTHFFLLAEDMIFYPSSLLEKFGDDLMSEDAEMGYENILYPGNLIDETLVKELTDYNREIEDRYGKEVRIYIYRDDTEVVGVYFDLQDGFDLDFKIEARKVHMKINRVYSINCNYLSQDKDKYPIPDALSIFDRKGIYKYDRFTDTVFK